MDKLRERLEMSRLLARELAGTIDEEEREKLNRWLAASPLHGQELDELRKVLESGDEAWSVQRHGERMTGYRWESFKRQTMKGKRLWIVWCRYAALFLLPLLSGIYFLGEWKKEGQPVFARESVITPGRAKAQLVMADGQHVELDEQNQICIPEPGGTEIQVSNNMVIYAKSDTVVSDLQHKQRHTLIVPKGGEYSLQLADGTRVWLNAGSTLTYPVYFMGNDRKVEMTGEIYFEVAKDRAKSFIVSVNGVDIRVLGTSFNVSAYKKEVITTLVEGQVRLTQGRDSVLLFPNQQAVWEGSGTPFHVKEVEARNFVLWKEGIFCFEDTDLETILDELSRWYDVDIFYRNSGLEKKRFTMEIKRYESVESILRRIEQTKRVKFEVKDRTINVYE